MEKRSTKTTFSLKDKDISSAAHIETPFFQHEQSDARPDVLNRISISLLFIQSSSVVTSSLT